MGILIAKAYPTNYFLRAADHTYVTCGTGMKSWGCWGGKKGGKIINQGVGSTKRADAIAQPNEKAGIKRYLIDGVCHQAANRILIPAKILVSDARGYKLSTAVFGTYGRGDFDTFENIFGDLDECMSGLEISKIETPLEQDVLDREIITANFRIYQKYKNINYLESLSFEEISKKFIDINMEIFSEEIKILSHNNIQNRKLMDLAKAKQKLELKLFKENFSLLESNDISHIKEIDRAIQQFQEDVGDILNDSEYEQILGLKRDERITLINPEAIDLNFGDGSSKHLF